MKRDMDLIRKILLDVEENLGPGDWGAVQLEAYDQPTVMAHVKMLQSAGLLDAHDSSGAGPSYILVKGITMPGYEFLDSMRNEGWWVDFKRTVAEKGGTLTLDIVKALALEYARRKIIP